MTQCRLYLITPETFELDSFLPQLESAFAGGDVAVLQLRMKAQPDQEVVAAAAKILPICREHNVGFILNDRAHLVAETGADGVHVGEDDMSAAEARKIVGEGKSVGVSCYASKHRAYEAGEQGADYVAFGAFYDTQTKPPRGRPTPELLEFWSQYTTLPCVAIGGIKPHNAAPLVKAGADYIAVVTGVWDHPDGPEAAVKEYGKVLQEVSEK